jgi:calcium-dependent protein kinase
MRGHHQQLSSPTAVLGHVIPPLRELYSLGRKLGQGQFSTTYLCTELAKGASLAFKSIAKHKLLTPEDVDDVRREIQIMHHLAGHPASSTSRAPTRIRSTSTSSWSSTRAGPRRASTGERRA